MQQFGALEHVAAYQASRARVAGIVEGTSVEPGAVDGAAEAEALIFGEQAAVFEVVLPSLGRVDFLPFFGADADPDELFQKSH